MPQIGTKGSELDLLIKQGCTFGPTVSTLKNPDDSPIDLTGSELRAQIRKTPNSSILKGIIIDFDITDAEAGEFTWGFSAEDTAGLSADSESETAVSSTFVWDMELQDSSGRVLPLLYGKAYVFREVTKE